MTGHDHTSRPRRERTVNEDLATALLAAIEEKESDAKDAKTRLTQRVAFAIGKTRGETENSMASMRVWEPLIAEAQDVVQDDIYGHPNDDIVRLCQAHREIVHEYRWAKQKQLEAHAAGAPAHHVDREQTVVRTLHKTLQILAGVYGVEAHDDTP